MKTKIGALAAIIGLVAAVLWIGQAAPGSTAFAEEHQLPGMCNGRHDENVVLTAHANGKAGEVPIKYILNLSSDALGDPAGVLVLGRGKERLQVTDWCRLWLHIPGEPYGDQCSADIPEGAITAHAVGIATYMGQQVLVRTDVRDTGEGTFFRVRHRVLGEHHEGDEVVEHDDGGCDDATWTRVPKEGWAPLDQLKVKAIEPAP